MNIFLLLMITVSGFFLIIGGVLRSIFRTKALDQINYRSTKYYYRLAKISEAIVASAAVSLFILITFFIIAN